MGKCKNCDHECHPYFAKKYDGYCLECANAGVGDFVDQIETLRARVAELEALTASLAERVHKQSELLSKRAEKA